MFLSLDKNQLRHIFKRKLLERAVLWFNGTVHASCYKRWTYFFEPAENCR